MNSLAPISGLVWPSAASRATCASCAVSTSGVSTVRLRTVSPVACNSRRARSANPTAPNRPNMSWAARSCFAGIHAPLPATQPLPIDQMGPSQLHPYTRSIEPLDRLAIERLGGVAAVTRARERAQHAERPVGARRARHVSKLIDGIHGKLSPVAPGGGLDQFGQPPVGDAQLGLGGLPGRGDGVFVSAQPVVEQCRRPLGDAQPGPVAPRATTSSMRPAIAASASTS